MSRFPITIYTDGACQGNPGPGGYGVVLITPYSRMEVSQYCGEKTTNNRMELSAVINALERIDEATEAEINIYSDSTYVCYAINKKWMLKWHKNGWKRDDIDIPNRDLWEKLFSLIRKLEVSGCNLIFTWVKGHANNKENNRCDEMAVRAIQNRRSTVTGTCVYPIEDK